MTTAMIIITHIIVFLVGMVVGHKKGCDDKLAEILLVNKEQGNDI